MTFSGKIWHEAPDINDLNVAFSTLLKNRDLNTDQEIADFFNPDLNKIHDPFLMAGMKVAVERIAKAVLNKERIIVFGDFDTDGITSTVILVDGLKKLGAQVSYRIPDREKDSHGLKTYLIDELIDKNIGLIITCDCGINDQAEVAHAKNLGMDVIITDHHDPDLNRFPDEAIAILNPKQAHCEYLEKNLSGSAVAFKLMSALATKFLPEDEQADFIEKYLEICAIGLVGDCVPLQNENRILTKFGLQKLKNTSWTGLQKLLTNAQVETDSINEETVGFAIAPRLNASSRVGNVLTASELFLGDKNKHDQRINTLENWNQERRELTETSVKESHAKIEEDAFCQFLVSKNWRPGILGLLCSRWSEQLDVPVIACTIRDDGILAASCRAPKGFSIIDALRSCPRELFENVGGHAGAAGFSAKEENAEQIKELLNKYFAQNIREPQKVPVEVFLSPEIFVNQAEDIVNFLKKMAPFGMGNDVPIWGMRGVKVLDFCEMGANKNHSRTTVEVGDEVFDFVNFFHGDYLDKISIGDEVDFAFTISENYFRGERRLQFRIVDGRIE